MINFNDIQIIRFDQIWIIFQIVKVLKLEKNIFLAIIWSKISKFFKKIQIIILIRWAKINNWQIRSFIFRKKMDNKWQQRQMFEDDWILNIFSIQTLIISMTSFGQKFKKFNSFFLSIKYPHLSMENILW